jgi:membrane-bound ClpP family serine protease
MWSGGVGMILMPVIMVSPILALLLFHFLPLSTALPIYVVILVIAAFCYVVMFQSMRAEAKTGLKAMIGREAVVIEDIDPEGKVKIKDELWAATAGGKKIAAGEKVRIVNIQGLVLIVECLRQERTDP